MLPTDAPQKPQQIAPQKPQQITQRPDFIGHFAYFNLTICYLTTIYRAYQAGDYPVLAFVIFVYVAYWGLDKCQQVYSRLPRGEKSLKKEMLRFTYCVLTSGILFGFAYQFGTFMPLAVVVMMYFLAVATSLLLFYVYYFKDDQNGRYEKIDDNSDNV